MNAFQFGVWCTLLLLSTPTPAAPTLFRVNLVTVPHQLVLDGELEPVEQGTLAAQIPGRVARLLVDVNDPIVAGQVLLEITSTEPAARLAQAEAALLAAETQEQDGQTQLRRMQSLLARGAVSRREFDAARVQAQAASNTVAQARAGIIQAREGLAYTRVRAPYAGIVSARHVAVGETVSPGQPLLSGFAVGRMRVVAYLPQSRLGALQPEQPFAVQLPDGAWLALSDYQLFPYAEPGSHSIRLRLPLPEQHPSAWRPGQWVKLAVPLGERRVLRVPPAAVLRQSELSAVYVARGERFQLRQVRLGAQDNQGVEILAGLEAGEQIAADAHELISQRGARHAP